MSFFQTHYILAHLKFLTYVSLIVGTLLFTGMSKQYKLLQSRNGWREKFELNLSSVKSRATNPPFKRIVLFNKNVVEI